MQRMLPVALFLASALISAALSLDATVVHACVRLANSASLLVAPLALLAAVVTPWAVPGVG